jgi:hypothetical protein
LPESRSHEVATMSENGTQYQLRSASGDLLEGLGESEAVDRIQALLSEWLRIENMVILSGAGCSMSQDGVTVAGLEKHVLDTLLDLGTDIPDLGTALSLIRARKEQVNDSMKDQANGPVGFETWLSGLATAEHALEASGSLFRSVAARLGSQDIHLTAGELSTLMAAISRIVVSRCSLTLPALSTNAPSGHHALVAKLVARDPTLGRAHLFTLNYDLLFESAADHLRIRYSTGFTGTVEPKFDSSAYALDLYYPGEVTEGRVERFDKFFHLYKLHGSIDWRRNSQSEIVRAASQLLPQWAEWQGWSRSCKLESLICDSDDAVAILPTESKYLQSIGMPYAHLFRALDAHLKTPQTFFLILGYGFGDEHINRIIDEALTNPGLVVLVVDPKPPRKLAQRLSRYQAAGERAFLLTGAGSAEDDSPQRATFEDFAVNLLPHVRWLDDYVKLRRVERVVRQENLGKASPQPSNERDRS